jgi:anoctamin-1
MTDQAKSKRNTFEHNLEQEGLVLSRQQHLQTGLHFVKIYAPIEVLKRYAEILKLRLPMKKFEHIQEVQAIRSTIPITGNVVKGVKNSFTEAFMYDQDKLARNIHELTAVFSRDKEYLFDMEKPNFFTQSAKARVIEFILKRQRLSAESIEDFSFGIERALSENVYTAAYPLHDVSLSWILLLF